ncbi:MAG: type I DNA topoisomerase [Calditrichota bacterium]
MAPKTRSIASGDKPAVPRDGGYNLIIVESPTKARTLTKYLQSGNLKFHILASGGHVRDLPPKRFGVDIEHNFQPEYEVLSEKSKIVSDLKAAAKRADNIYLATDPDREGEAIAWHINCLIDPPARTPVWRVQFHEITKSAVQAALQSPGRIDQHKVDAQQARHILDRLVGYQVSPLLWKTVSRGLSAGRVQSVALRLICEREAEITAFVQEEYWTIDGLFKGEKVAEFTARLSKLDGKKAEIATQEQSKTICERVQTAKYYVSDVQVSHKKRTPAPPYTTSTLQQDAGRRLGLPVKRAMAIAQKLYEGIELGDKGAVGLITYMRTDSTRVAEEAVNNLRQFIAGAYGDKYLASKPRHYKNKKGPVQDAHEAIRPTDVTITPESVKGILAPPEYKLYDMIWRRFVATQMHEAEVDVTVVIITDGKGIELRASGQVITFPGYLTIYEDTAANSNNEDDKQDLPPGLTVGLPLELLKLDPRQHFTQPPPRFTEAGLVKELDELGIGRPSTYATIISTLLDRKYVDHREKALAPTELGITVNRVLVDRFPDVFNVEFTAKMEEELDRIETGDPWLKTVEDFYTPFNLALQAAEAQYKEVKRELVAQPVGRPCPQCGGDLVYRWSRHGKFISCSNFPKCKFAENLAPAAEPVPSTETCPQCGSPMVVREGRFGRFLGCSKYPKCKGLLNIASGYKCPRQGCEGDLVKRRSKTGRNFYGCNKYPTCDFASWDEPAGESCPQCGAPTVFIKKTTKAEPKVICRICNWSRMKVE